MSNSKNLIANRYEVFQHIGQGGMADVFLAVDTILNRQVAIKILRSELCTDAVSVLRFEREARRRPRFRIQILSRSMMSASIKATITS